MSATKSTAVAAKPRAPRPVPPALKAVPLDHPVNTKVTEEWVELTPERAEVFLSRNKRNRNLRPSKVREYATDMRNGKWKTTGDPIRFDWNGNLIDGQHRCHAVVESGTTVRVLVIKGLDPEAQEVIDTGAKRSAGDALKFAGFEGDTIILAAVARISSARELGYLRSALSTTMPPLSNSDVIEWAQANEDAQNAIALARRTRDIGIQPAVWAYCLHELEKIDGPVAVEFATSMHEYRLAGKGDPRRALVSVFRQAAEGRRRKPGVGESIYVVFRAWNAWVTGKSLTVLLPGAAGGADIPKPVKPTRAVAS